MCELFNVASCMEIPEFSNDQEELGKKVCLHALNSLTTYPHQHVIIKTHSGDVDINVLLTSLITDWKEFLLMSVLVKQEEFAIV